MLRKLKESPTPNKRNSLQRSSISSVKQIKLDPLEGNLLELDKTKN